MTKPTASPVALVPVAFAKVLADETRQRIMQRCCCCWCSVTELVDALGGDVAQPTVSHHLAVLREAGLVRLRRDGRQAFYTLDQGRVAACCGQLLTAFAPETAAAAAVCACEVDGSDGCGNGLAGENGV